MQGKYFRIDCGWHLIVCTADNLCLLSIWGLLSHLTVLVPAYVQRILGHNWELLQFHRFILFTETPYPYFIAATKRAAWYTWNIFFTFTLHSVKDGGNSSSVVLPFKYSGGVGFDRILPLNLWSIIIGFGTWSPGRTNVGPQVDAVGNCCDANSILGWFTNPIGGISEHSVEKIYFSSLWTCNPWTFFFPPWLAVCTTLSHKVYGVLNFHA